MCAHQGPHTHQKMNKTRLLDEISSALRERPMFLPGLNNNQIEQTKQALRLPEGTIEFRYRSPELFDTDIPIGVLVQAITDGVFLKLVRDSKLGLHFIHSSSKYGTRVATIDLSHFVGSAALRITLIWSPETIGLGVVDSENPLRSQAATGEDLNTPLRTATAQSEAQFKRNLQSILDQLKILTGLTRNDNSHPLVSHLISAEQEYSSNRLLGCAQAAYAKLAIEDLEIVRKKRVDLFEHFKRELRRTSIDNYYGLRLEIRIAASLITSNTAFRKAETPDFILIDFPSTGIECTSAHLDLQNTAEPSQVVYKVIRAIEEKTGFKYKTVSNILSIDVSNLLFHEGHETCSKFLADKDKALPLLKERVNSSTFQSMLYFSYSWKAFEDKGVILQSFYARIDRDGADPNVRRFLDSRFPRGDVWNMSHISKIV